MGQVTLGHPLFYSCHLVMEHLSILDLSACSLQAMIKALSRFAQLCEVSPVYLLG